MSLFDSITSFGNLYAAYKAASRGRHSREDVLRHDLHAEKILFRLKWQLENGAWRHGPYRTFTVYDPKERLVSAAPFTDRIVHHAIHRVIEPIFDRAFIYDSYACRGGKGTHQAVLRLQHFLRSAAGRFGQFYVLRVDIAKFFATIDHGILLALIAKKVYDRQTIGLLEEIIRSYAPGVPIGNLTSQLFANVYLNELDQFVKHGLRQRYYLRYMDDFLIIHPSKEHLHQARQEIEDFARSELALQLHPVKTNAHKFAGRERFVGYDAEPHVRRLSKPTVQRFMRRLNQTLQKQGEEAALESWRQFAAYSSFAHAKGLMAAINPFGKAL